MHELKTKEEVAVRLLRRGLQPEICRVSYISEGLNGLLGILLEEPKQNFGEAYHKGSVISFVESEYAEESRSPQDEDALRQVRYSADLTPPGTWLRADLEDGKLVCDAISDYHTDGSVENLDKVLRLLRDSQVWVPYMPVDPDAAARFSREEDPLGILGTKYRGENDAGDQAASFTEKKKQISVPDLLQAADGSALYFPVFTRTEIMGDYLVEEYDKKRMPFLEAVTLAKESPRGISGVLVNPFSETFFADARIFPMLLSMPTSIAEPETEKTK